jgi:hypothetical protein
MFLVAPGEGAARVGGGTRIKRLGWEWVAKMEHPFRNVNSKGVFSEDYVARGLRRPIRDRY